MSNELIATMAMIDVSVFVGKSPRTEQLPLLQCQTSRIHGDVAIPQTLTRRNSLFLRCCKKMTACIGTWMLTIQVSEMIAPKLVVVDGENNGWRQLVLPLTQVDHLVENAVTSAALSYLSASFLNGVQRHCAHHKVISGLRLRSMNATHNTLERQCVIVTFLILLATLLVNGWPDFRIAFASLELCMQVNQFDDQLLVGDLGHFLAMQVEK